MSEEKTLAKKGQIGLVNLGNTCFLNSALQLLRQSKSLRAYFQSSDWEKGVNQSKYAPMVEPISALIKSIWREDLQKGTRISPGKFYTILTDIASKVGYDDLAVKYRQCDAGEALLFLVDCLHEGLAHTVEMAVTGVPVTPEEKRLHTSYTQWTKHYKKQWSVVAKVFHGQKMSAITCKKCQYHSENFESWNSLSIPILNGTVPGSPAPTLMQCLGEYFKDETIDDYQCESCGNKQAANHTIRLSILPKNLILIINRFTNMGQKVRAKIDFNLDMLDLDNWFIGNKEKTNTVYKTISVIDHRGIMQGGHYYASSRDDTNQKQWIRYDDDGVGEMPSEHVNNGDTYVILLEQQNDESPQKGK